MASYKRVAVKTWWKSKTLWFNAVVAALAGAEASFSFLQPIVPVNVYGILAFVLAVGNSVLRLITSQPITGKS